MVSDSTSSASTAAAAEGAARARLTSGQRRKLVWGAAVMQASAAIFLLLAALLALAAGAGILLEPAPDRGVRALLDTYPSASAAVFFGLLLGFALAQWTAVNLWRSRATWVLYPIGLAFTLIGGGLLLVAVIGGVVLSGAAREHWGAQETTGAAAGLLAALVAGFCMLPAGALAGWAGLILDRETPLWLRNTGAWPERFAITACLAVAATLVAFTLYGDSIGVKAILWLAFLAGLGFASWLGWFKLLGPVLFYDMVRTARQNRYFILRMLYAGFLFFALSYLIFITWMMEREFKFRQHAVVAETFFMVFMLVQLGLVVLLTPAYVAGSIADEKDRKTLEFMLATDLRNREIILSKLLSRLGNMSLLLLTGLPILSILQFIGGIDPNLMLAGFVAIALTMVGVGSISILFSTLFKKPRDAIGLTYLFLIAYAALATTGMLMQLAGHVLMRTPLWFGAAAYTIGDVTGVLNAGNPLAAVWTISMAIGGRGGGSLAAILPSLLERYAWFHLTLAAVCVTWSIVRLRAIALKQTMGGETAELRWWERFRPGVGNFPMLWKELFIEGRTKLNWLTWLAVFVLLLLTVGSGVWVLGLHLYEVFFEGRANRLERIPESMNIWFRVAGTFVACVLLLRIGVRASTSITTERERDTLDALVTTPLSADGMLFAKLLGNLKSSWLGWVWYVGMLVLALCSLGMHPLAIPLILASCFVYAVFMTMLGLAFSLFCRSSLVSAVFTVMTTVFLGGGHWLITSCFCMPLFGAVLAVVNLQFRIPPQMMDILSEAGLYFVKVQAGLTPPFVLAYGSVPFYERHGARHDRHFWELIGASFVGLAVWAAASALLWFAVLAPRFRRMTRRIEIDDQP